MQDHRVTDKYQEGKALPCHPKAGTRSGSERGTGHGKAENDNGDNTKAVTSLGKAESTSGSDDSKAKTSGDDSGGSSGGSAGGTSQAALL